ncbi:MAG: NADH-quinone oxidoreductase subunit NuoG [Burkholderiaceae bacterium]|jgi:NADH-quinone oxidoreductase subunit G|nr:NADH-quinone oxidoreductase subunit NuoG [Burkholderiaceae bacterium]
MPEFRMDGRLVPAEEGSTVLEAMLASGGHIPHFCYHKKLSASAVCRMCLVEVEGNDRLQPACILPVSPGMSVHSRSARVRRAQKAVMEFLLRDHPLDCPVCDQGGECLLQEVSLSYGHDRTLVRTEPDAAPLHFVPDWGPLLSAEGMARCIHCTRCIRFGEEVAGTAELGVFDRLPGRPAVRAIPGKALHSPLSGNLIDVCPVGALTSKPFRFGARHWELTNRYAVSPHDSLGANLCVQTRHHQVMRVLPWENEAINECWLSDRDRFSCEALGDESRLTHPLIKQDNRWLKTDWQTALRYVAHGLDNIRANHGADALASLTSPQATLEEMFLLRKLTHALGSGNMDFRTRQSDCSLDGRIIPWLGMSVEEIDKLDSALVVGSFLLEEHPLLAVRFRRAARRGAQISRLCASGEDWHMPVAHNLLLPPSHWLAALACIMQAVARRKGCALPTGFSSASPIVRDGQSIEQEADAVAATLLQPGCHALFLGHAASRHPDMALLHTACEWLGQQTGARLGHLVEGANAVGGHFVGLLPSRRRPLLEEAHIRAWLILHAEPEYDMADGARAKRIVSGADMVVVMSPFRHSEDVADVMLPCSPFTETSGTYLNCAGVKQRFHGAVRPLGQTRPAWKVLCALGSLLGQDGWTYDSSEAVHDAIPEMADGRWTSRLNNLTGELPVFRESRGEGLERISEVPLYHADAIVRRARALQETESARDDSIALPVSFCQQEGITAGMRVAISQEGKTLFLPAVPSAHLPDGVVRISASHPASAALGALWGHVTVRRA